MLVVAGIVALAGCGGGGGGDDQGKRATPSTTVVPNTNVSLQLGDVSADSAGPPAQVSPEQSQAILKVVGDYLTAATVNPLRSAQPAGDLSALFGAGALARVTGPDRAVLVDEGLPKVTGDLNVTAQPIAVVGLGDQGGAIVLATATIDLDIQGVTTTRNDPLRIVRKGDLVLTPDAVRRVEGHRVQHRRRTIGRRDRRARHDHASHHHDQGTQVTRSRTRRRALVTLVVSPLVCGLVVATLAAGAWVAVGSPRPAAAAVWFQVTKLGGARYTPAPDRPFFALILGTGARSDDPNQSGDDPGLADAVHVIGVNPALNAATIIDIPRDTEGPGGQKINSYIVTRSDNDLRTMADAVSSVTGAPISYVIRVNFPNFVQMVDEMGGIDINIPTPMNDSFSGAEFAAGPNHLTGDQALAFSRDRHSFSSGDIARTENQGLLILSALQTLRNRNLSAGDTVRLVANRRPAREARRGGHRRAVPAGSVLAHPRPGQHQERRAPGRRRQRFEPREDGGGRIAARRLRRRRRAADALARACAPPALLRSSCSSQSRSVSAPASRHAPTTPTAVGRSPCTTRATRSPSTTATSS